MITTNVIHRVFNIQCGDLIGMGFTVEVEGKEYLITAKHVVESLDGEGNIGILSNAEWRKEEVNLVGHSPDDADISVLALTRILTPPNLPMEMTSGGAGGVFYGQDVYFLGFPYGQTGPYAFGDDGYPLPYVKKAIISLLDRKKFILDGHNNSGFSGGPVVYREPGKDDLNVAAVISSYSFVDEPVFRDGEKTDLTYQYNTGIIQADSIIWARELIQANPIGLTVA
jgi:hypothetical protein